MPGNTYTGLTADGTLSLTGSQLIYGAARLTLGGTEYRRPDPNNTDKVLRAAWFSIGDTLDPFGDGSAEYWREEVWVDFEHTLWTPLPTTVAPANATIFGTIVRYHVASGVTLDLFLYTA